MAKRENKFIPLIKVEYTTSTRLGGPQSYTESLCLKVV